MNHFLLMVVYAAMVGTFFALLSRRAPREQGILFAKVFFGLVLGGVAISWLMYFFPSGPPASIP